MTYVGVSAGVSGSVAAMVLVVAVVAVEFGPGLPMALCVGWDRPGWYVVGGLFAVTGLLAPPAVGRTRRSKATRSVSTPVVEQVASAS
ncbi:hypothetical protein [Streptomyces sp. IMTB 2501]|uniref:hypothetical protein n=1 Tax=Streptomyces sp. IMTB 2501 TaxID=1776340 RepID=UPI0011809603|nr:hypothetical protein [Streptomyces sp. IMTB 2501]